MILLQALQWAPKIGECMKRNVLAIHSQPTIRWLLDTDRTRDDSYCVEDLQVAIPELPRHPGLRPHRTISGD
jgi:hypothetical protein